MMLFFLLPKCKSLKINILGAKVEFKAKTAEAV
jgi:hypothetical protein